MREIANEVFEGAIPPPLKENKPTCFLDCQFIGIDFSGCSLCQSRFLSCHFKKCSFVTTPLEKARLFVVHFSESKLMGVDFTLCDDAFFEVHFDKCLLRGCNFSHLKMEKSQWTTCQIKECHFALANLQKTNFTKSDLEGSTFHHTQLEGADFTDATSYQIDPMANKIKGATFSSPEALSLLNGLEIKIIS